MLFIILFKSLHPPPRASVYETSPSDVEFIFRVYIRPRPLTRRGHAVEDVSSVWKLDDRPVTFSSPAVLLGVLEVKHEWKGESWPSLAVEPCTGSGRSLNSHGSFLKKKRCECGEGFVVVWRSLFSRSSESATREAYVSIRIPRFIRLYK